MIFSAAGFSPAVHESDCRLPSRTFLYARIYLPWSGSLSADGKGFDVKNTFTPKSHRSFGIYGLWERLSHFGGLLTIKSKPGKGTTVLMLCRGNLKSERPNDSFFQMLMNTFIIM